MKTELSKNHKLALEVVSRRRVDSHSRTRPCSSNESATRPTMASPEYQIQMPRQLFVTFRQLRFVRSKRSNESWTRRLISARAADGETDTLSLGASPSTM